MIGDRGVIKKCSKVMFGLVDKNNDTLTFFFFNSNIRGNLALNFVVDIWVT